MQICPFFDKLLQLSQAAKAELFGIKRQDLRILNAFYILILEKLSCL